LQKPVSWLRDLPIWTKLGLILIVPIISTIIVGSFGLSDKIASATNAERAQTLAALSGDAGNLVHALQNERAVAVQLLDADGSDVAAMTAEYTKATQATDDANRDYTFRRGTLSDVPATLQGFLDGITSELGELQQLRSQVAERSKIAGTSVSDTYTVDIADLINIRTLAAQLTGDSTLTARLAAASAIATASEALSQERVLVDQALTVGQLSTPVYGQYIGTLKGQEQAIKSFTAVATNDQKALYNRTVTGAKLRESQQYEARLNALADRTIPPNTIPPDQWDSAMAARGDLMNSVENELNQEAQQAAADLGKAVQRQVWVEVGLLGATMLLGVLFATLVARSMARSLRDLRQGALAVAQYGLPHAVARLRDPSLSTQMSPGQIAQQIAEPLPVRSRDEFGQVTEAFNAVHLEAVRTAAEQAALRSSVATMFVNLARRSQILVDRLIGHLDRLERGEQDPDRLSELFQLDHLATRMRRNDENLLVLAAADSTRIQREPAALMDVLRAAQSEVEHYTRIEFGVIDQDIEIAAHAVNDLVHLVAELFDNATAFSAPDTTVVVEARRIGDRALLQVSDRGIGMAPDQYSELNERLATPPLVDVAVSRMMGLVVVSRLSSRHSVKVELRPAEERGTVADVLLPGGVLVPRAMAGRTQAPIGFPASRPMASAPNLPTFPAPLALESGIPSPYPMVPGAPFPPVPAPPFPSGVTPAAAAPSWPPADLGNLPPGLRPSGPPSAPVSPPFVPPAPPFGPPNLPPPPAGVPGLGAALAGDGWGAPPPPNGASGSAGRAAPAWHDLTGASGPAVPPGNGYAPSPGAPSDVDPLPHRRGAPGPGEWGGAEWGAAEWGAPDDTPSGAIPVPPGPVEPPPPVEPGPPVWGAVEWGSPGPELTTPPVPRQTPTTPEIRLQPSPFEPPPMGSPIVPASGVPGTWPPSPPVPGSAGSSPFADGPPAAARPPVWPPVAPEPEIVPEPMPTVPGRLTEGLDLTAEIPRLRQEDPADLLFAPEVPYGMPDSGSVPAPPSRYADDLTMELPIFRELESAWFRTGAEPPSGGPDAESEYASTFGAPAGAPGLVTQGARVGESAGNGVPHQAAASAGGSPRRAEGVSWRTAADDGWSAAQAAADPQDAGTTDQGLPKRVPMAQLVPGGVETASASGQRRTPDAVRGLLSAYHRGVQRGRQGSSSEPTKSGPSARGAGSTARDTGKEQEA
jgi:signal transduction histidine kinase